MSLTWILRVIFRGPRWPERSYVEENTKNMNIVLIPKNYQSYKLMIHCHQLNYKGIVKSNSE